MPTRTISELEKDILKELMNIILAKAGDSFAKISKEPVIINVPDLHMVNKETALTELFDNREIEVIVQSEIKGDIYAHSLIIFSQDQINLFENACLRNLKITKAIRESLLLEISNIVTGTLVSHIADILNFNIYGSVPNAPVYKENLKEKDLLLDLDLTRPVLFTVNALFQTSENKVSIPLILIFDVPNLEKVIERVRKINKDEFRLFKR